MRFIVVDGLDAAGKDTHAELIKKRYEERGDVIIRSHPSEDNRYGKKAKRALYGGGKKDRVKASYYYALDILRSLHHYYGKVDTLIFVRYLCGVAYIPRPFHKTVYEVLSSALPTTDYMFFLDVHPRRALERVKNRKRTEMFENLESFKNVRKKALGMIDDWHIIDTNQPIGEAQEEIDSILERLDGDS